MFIKNANAEDFIKSKLLEYRTELEEVLNGGDISHYNYDEAVSDETGYRYDRNDNNRLRISLAIWYMSENLDVEFLTVALMNEEIKSLENSPYGGTSRTIFLLSSKILEYKKASYKDLFRRARHANFDCFFECDIDIIKKSLKRFSDWHNADWDYIFCLLDDEESQKMLKDFENSKE
ncbi:MAG: hypothetical protein K2G63_04865 [Oscillospiraceae bacterium]|nr:hypothetical protein [Oscillospiraceae bacterium]